MLPLKSELLKNVLVLGLAIFLSMLGISSFTQVSFKTGDDSKNIHTLLEKSKNENVLGASTEDSNYLFGCTEEKPVIGWINYAGEKEVRTTLPEGETASSCFVNLKEANKDGFF